MTTERPLKPITHIEPIRLADCTLGYELQIGLRPIIVRSDEEGLLCLYCRNRKEFDERSCRHVEAVLTYLREFEARSQLLISQEFLQTVYVQAEAMGRQFAAAQAENAQVYHPLLAQAQRYTERLGETVRELLSLAQKEES